MVIEVVRDEDELELRPQHFHVQITIQALLAGLKSSRFQDTLQQISLDDMAYKPGFDGSQAQVQLDLNEPASALSQLFMAYVGTPPSAYMAYPYARGSELVSAPAPHDPSTDGGCVDEGDALMERGRRVPRRRGYGKGAHVE
ncbi:hypothetical protein PIB30_023727 [Stylosanthes scabra]|uniref:Uncharacterized protein n=1 Tax=Stylosanthes scabra TaxID=79078 RepID=A0ABU6VBU7_9FABA|nr:hypothetical protein [Stylosanthes scabra]